MSAGLGGFFTGLGASMQQVQSENRAHERALEIADWQYEKQVALGDIAHERAVEVAGITGKSAQEMERFKNALGRPEKLLNDITKRIEIINGRLKGDNMSIVPSAEEKNELNTELNRLRTMHRSVQGFLASGRDMTPDILSKMWPMLYGTETASGGTTEPAGGAGLIAQGTPGAYYPGAENSASEVDATGSPVKDEEGPPRLTPEQKRKIAEDRADTFWSGVRTVGGWAGTALDVLSPVVKGVLVDIKERINEYNQGDQEEIANKVNEFMTVSPDEELTRKLINYLKEKIANRSKSKEENIEGQIKQSFETGSVREEEDFLSSLRSAEASGEFSVNDRSVADNDSSFLRSLVESGQGLIQKGTDFLFGGDEELDLSDPASSARQYGDVKGSDFIGSTEAIDALGEAGGPVGEPLSGNRKELMDSIKQMIHSAESTVGGYNAVAGTKGDSTLTSMTLGQIHKKHGDTAVGIGQFKRRYLLNNAKKYMNLDEAGLDKIIFDREVQDKFLEFGILESGFDSFVDGTLSSDKFLSNLAVRWRGLPSTIGQNKGDSSDKHGNIVQLPGSEAREILDMWKDFSK